MVASKHIQPMLHDDGVHLLHATRRSKPAAQVVERVQVGRPAQGRRLRVFLIRDVDDRSFNIIRPSGTVTDGARLGPHPHGRSVEAALLTLKAATVPLRSNSAVHCARASGSIYSSAAFLVNSVSRSG